MSNVLIDRQKIDILANAISDKSGVPVTMTLAEMVEAVDGIETGGITPTGNINITHSGSTDVTNYATATVPEADCVPVTDNYFTTISGQRKWHNDGYVSVSDGGWVSQPISVISTNYNAIPTGTTITPTESSQTIGGADYMMEGAVTVNAIPSDYVGSGITRRDSTDLSASDATVTVPSGYYSAQASKSVASGTAGTPTATKGTVSNHSISVTPSVTNTTGYITGSTKTGTAVTVSASELVSGSETKTENGTYDVTNLAELVVDVQGGSVTWETIYNGNVTIVSDSPNYVVINNFTDPSLMDGQTWRVTWNGTQYICPVEIGSDQAQTRFIGNKGIVGYAGDDSNEPFFGYMRTSTQLAFVTTDPAGTIPLKMELQQSSSATLIEKTITTNGTYNATDDSADGYSSVTVNVQGGGGELIVDYSSASLATPSASISFTGLSGDPTSFVVLTSADLATGAAPYKTAAVVFDGASLHGQTITNTNNAQVTYDGTNFTKLYSNGTLTITGTSYFQATTYYLTYTYGGGTIDTKDVQVGSGATSITFTGLEDQPSYWSCIFKSNFSTSSGYQRVIAVVYDGGTTMGLEMDSGSHSAQHWMASYNNGSLTITSQGTNQGGYFHQPGYYQLTYAYDDGSGGNYQSKTVTPTTSQQVVEADTGYDALKKVTVNAIPSEYIVPSGNINITSNTATGQTLNVAQYATATVAVPTGSGVNIATATMTNSSNQNTSIDFTLPSGRTPKAFFARLTSQIARSSNSRYYYVFDMRWDGSSTGGVAGNTFYMYSGTLTNVTSGYSYSQSGTTFTLSSTGSRSASPGSFYNGTYELVYVY